MNAESIENPALVGRPRSGDTSAVRGLRAACGSRIYRSPFENREDAEGVTRDVLLRVFQKITPSGVIRRCRRGSTGSHSTRRGLRRKTGSAYRTGSWPCVETAPSRNYRRPEALSSWTCSAGLSDGVSTDPIPLPHTVTARQATWSSHAMKHVKVSLDSPATIASSTLVAAEARA